jgi:hypothetical protein
MSSLYDQAGVSMVEKTVPSQSTPVPGLGLLTASLKLIHAITGHALKIEKKEVSTHRQPKKPLSPPQPGTISSKDTFRLLCLLQGLNSLEYRLFL